MEEKNGKYDITSSIEKQLKIETLQSELLRVQILALIAFLIAAGLTILAITLHAIDVHFDHSYTAFYISIIILIFFFLREVYIAKFLKNRLKIEKFVSNKTRFINVFLETSIPSVVLIILSYYWESVLTLSTPVIFLYIIVVILTTLSLDFKLSLFSGVVATAEFLVITFYVLSKFDYPDELYMLNLPYIHIGKGLLILLSSVIAGLVAEQMKKRIISTHKILFERNRIVNMFGQQVSQEIVDELISHETELESTRKFVCIMFLDIRGFTPFAESREPEDIIKYQNNVFGFMIDHITEHHGIINQFLGDGYMATFGAPISKGNDCQNAVNAALQIVEEINSKSKAGVIPKTRIGIGLHAGYVVAGNVGSSVRKQYSISGNTVILASRIEQMNKTFNSQLLISHEVLEQINADDLNYESLGEVELKGRAKPIVIYKLA